MIYSIDYETRSAIDLVDQGLDIYANDHTTEVLCIAFGTAPDNVQVCQGNTVVRNAELLDHVRNGGKIQGWNVMFEYAIWNCVCVPKYGWPELKLEQCIDTMALAAVAWASKIRGIKSGRPAAAPGALRATRFQCG